MIVTTTNSIDGRSISAYLGLVSGEAVVGANILRDFLGSITDFTGGRSLSRQNAFREARAYALKDMQDLARQIGADAIVGVDVDYEVLGQQNGMILVSINGTAVRLGGAVGYDDTDHDDPVTYAPAPQPAVVMDAGTIEDEAEGVSFADALTQARRSPRPIDEDDFGPADDPGLYGPDGSTDRKV